MISIPDAIEMLVCPITGRPLTVEDGKWLVAQGGDSRYPIEDGIPDFSGASSFMDESERAHYENSGNLAATQSTLARSIEVARARPTAIFLEPYEAWIDARYDCAAQYEAYSHLAPVADRVMLQIGGSGSHAIKFLASGAKLAILVTPVGNEARTGKALADRLGVAARFLAVIGYVEQLALRHGSIDCAYAGGVAHHTDTRLLAEQLARILKPGGKFAAAEPWKAPMYSIGTRIFGKREPGVRCTPH